MAGHRGRAEHQRPLARHVRVEVALAEADPGAPLGDVGGEAGEVVAEAGGPVGVDHPFVGADREAVRVGLVGPGPGFADDRAAVMAGQPLVPDRGAVLLDRVRGQRRRPQVHPLAYVAQVVVDPVVDLVLHPDRGRLGEPGVLVGVVAELEDVVVLVGHGHLEVVARFGARELEGAVVVVEDQVAVQVDRLAAVDGLAAVGGGVAEELATDLGEVDVGLAVAAADGPVGERLLPAELAVLDVVDVFGDRQHPFDVVGDPVAVGVLEVRRVEALVDPVDAEVGVAGGRVGCLGDVVLVAARRDPFAGPFQRFGRPRARLDEGLWRGGGDDWGGEDEHRESRGGKGGKAAAHPEDPSDGVAWFEMVAVRP